MHDPIVDYGVSNQASATTSGTVPGPLSGRCRSLCSNIACLGKPHECVGSCLVMPSASGRIRCPPEGDSDDSRPGSGDAEADPAGPASSSSTFPGPVNANTAGPMAYGGAMHGMGCPFFHARENSSSAAGSYPHGAGVASSSSSRGGPGGVTGGTHGASDRTAGSVPPTFNTRSAAEMLFQEEPLFRPPGSTGPRHHEEVRPWAAGAGRGGAIFLPLGPLTQLPGFAGTAFSPSVPGTFGTPPELGQRPASFSERRTPSVTAPHRGGAGDTSGAAGAGAGAGVAGVGSGGDAGWVLGRGIGDTPLQALGAMLGGSGGVPSHLLPTLMGQMLQSGLMDVVAGSAGLSSGAAGGAAPHSSGQRPPFPFEGQSSGGYGSEEDGSPSMYGRYLRDFMAQHAADVEEEDEDAWEGRYTEEEEEEEEEEDAWVTDEDEAGSQDTDEILAAALGPPAALISAALAAASGRTAQGLAAAGSAVPPGTRLGAGGSVAAADDAGQDSDSELDDLPGLEAPSSSSEDETAAAAPSAGQPQQQQRTHPMNVFLNRPGPSSRVAAAAATATADGGQRVQGCSTGHALQQVEGAALQDEDTTSLPALSTEEGEEEDDSSLPGLESGSAEDEDSSSLPAWEAEGTQEGDGSSSMPSLESDSDGDHTPRVRSSGSDPSSSGRQRAGQTTMGIRRGFLAAREGGHQQQQRQVGASRGATAATGTATVGSGGRSSRWVERPAAGSRGGVLPGAASSDDLPDLISDPGSSDEDVPDLTDEDDVPDLESEGSSASEHSLVCQTCTDDSSEGVPSLVSRSSSDEEEGAWGEPPQQQQQQQQAAAGSGAGFPASWDWRGACGRGQAGYSAAGSSATGAASSRVGAAAPAGRSAAATTAALSSSCSSEEEEDEGDHEGDELYSPGSAQALAAARRKRRRSCSPGRGFVSALGAPSSSTATAAHAVVSTVSRNTGQGHLAVVAPAGALVNGWQRVWWLVRAAVSGGLGGVARVLRVLLLRVPWIGQWRVLRQLAAPAAAGAAVDAAASSTAGEAGRAPVLLPSPRHLLVDRQEQGAGQEAPASAAAALLVIPLQVGVAAPFNHGTAAGVALGMPRGSEQGVQVSTSRAQPVLPPRRVRHAATPAGAATSTSTVTSTSTSGAAPYSRPRSNAFVGQLPGGVGNTCPTATSRTAHIGLYGVSPTFATNSGSSSSWVGVLPGVSGLVADGAYMQQLLEGLPGVDPAAAVVAASVAQIRGAPLVPYVAA